MAVLASQRAHTHTLLIKIAEVIVQRNRVTVHLLVKTINICRDKIMNSF